MRWMARLYYTQTAASCQWIFTLTEFGARGLTKTRIRTILWFGFVF